jgi:hypothetical protein
MVLGSGSALVSSNLTSATELSFLSAVSRDPIPSELTISSGSTEVYLFERLSLELWDQKQCNDDVQEIN